MDRDERLEKYHLQTTEQYAAIGRFVQQFEHVLWTLRLGCEFLFGEKSDLQRRMFHILLGHQGVTAATVFSIHRAFVAEVIAATEMRLMPGEERRVITKVLTYIAGEGDELTKARNTLLHGTWFIGYASEEQTDFSEFSLHKSRISARGLEQTPDVPKTAAEIDTLTERCRALADVAGLVSTVLFANLARDQDPRIRFNIRPHGTKWVTRTEARRQKLEPAEGFDF